MLQSIIWADKHNKKQRAAIKNENTCLCVCLRLCLCVYPFTRFFLYIFFTKSRTFHRTSSGGGNKKRPNTSRKRCRKSTFWDLCVCFSAPYLNQNELYSVHSLHLKQPLFCVFAIVGEWVRVNGFVHHSFFMIFCMRQLHLNQRTNFISPNANT